MAIASPPDYCLTCGLKRCPGRRAGVPCPRRDNRCGHLVHGAPCVLTRGHGEQRHLTAAGVEEDRRRVAAYRRNRYATDTEWAGRIRRNMSARAAGADGINEPDQEL